MVSMDGRRGLAFDASLDRKKKISILRRTAQSVGYHVGWRHEVGRAPDQAAQAFLDLEQEKTSTMETLGPIFDGDEAVGISWQTPVEG